MELIEKSPEKRSAFYTIDIFCSSQKFSTIINQKVYSKRKTLSFSHIFYV